GANATNADGTVVVGSSMYRLPQTAGVETQRGFRVVVPGGMENLGARTQWGSSGAAAVCADGKIIAGRDSGSNTIVPDGFRWAQASGFEALGNIAPAGMSADGKVVVGGSFDVGFGHAESAARWVNGKVMSLGVYGPALAVSADGSVIVGQ